jgi:hypothetical protein
MGLATYDDQMPKPFMQRIKPNQKISLTILKPWCIVHYIHTMSFNIDVEDQMNPCQLYCEILQPNIIIYNTES